MTIQNEESHAYDLMVTLDQPFTTMIANKSMKINFRNRVDLHIRRDDRIWVYETKKNTGSGKIIGKYKVRGVFPMDIINGPDRSMEELYEKHFLVIVNFCFDNNITVPLCPTTKWIYNTFKEMIDLYVCYRHDNQRVSIFLNCMMDLKDYGKLIGEGSKYAILIDDFEQIQMDISEFKLNRNDMIMERPPRNMCRVRRIQKN